MEVILLKDVPNLGKANQIKTVKDGYARNYLIPRAKVVIANDSNLRTLAARKKGIEKREKIILELYKTYITKLDKVKIVLPVKANEKGKIFGSVTNFQVSEALKKAGFEINRHQVELQDKDIKEVNKYKADIILTDELKTTIEFELKPE